MRASLFSEQIGSPLATAVTAPDIDVNEETPASLALAIAAPMLETAGETAEEVGQLEDGTFVVCGATSCIHIDPVQETADVLELDEDIATEQEFEEETLVESGLSKKHFIASAKQIKAMADRKAAHHVAHHTAEIFASSNPRFDRSRYLSAAGVSESGEDIATEQEAAAAMEEFATGLQEFISQRIPLEKRNIDLTEQFDLAVKDGFADEALSVVEVMADAAGEMEALLEYRRMKSAAYQKILRSRKRPKSAKQRQRLLARRKAYRQNAAQLRRKHRVYYRRFHKQFREAVDVLTVPTALGEAISGLLTEFGWETPLIETATAGEVDVHVQTELADAAVAYLSGDMGYGVFEDIVGNPARGKEGTLRITNYTGPGAGVEGGFQPTTGVEAPIPGADADDDYDDDDEEYDDDSDDSEDYGDDDDDDDDDDALAQESDEEFEARMNALREEDLGAGTGALPTDHVDPQDGGPAPATDTAASLAAAANGLTAPGTSTGTAPNGSPISMGVDALRAQHPELSHLNNADLLAVECVTLPKSRVLEFTKLADNSGVASDACVVLAKGVNEVVVLFPKEHAAKFRTSFHGDGITFTSLTS